MAKDPVAVVTERLAALRTMHAGRNFRRQEWKHLRRGLDPRKQRGANAVGWSKSMAEGRLRTNDPVTFFNTVVHLLSARDIKWRLPVQAGDTEGEARAGGVLERWVTSIFRQNDERLLKSGRSRLQRAVADSACETGVSIVYKEAGVSAAGVFWVKFDPVNPKGVYERFDTEGLAEIANSFEVLKRDAVVECEMREGWTVPPKWDRANLDGTAGLTDYWSRTFVSGKPVVHEMVVLDGVLVFSGEVAEEDLPFEVRYINGESFPDDFERRAEHASAYTAQSVLEPNAKTYLDESDYIAKLHLHLDEVLKSPMQEFTGGGIPKADPALMDPSKPERLIQTYDTQQDKGLVPTDVSQVSPIVGTLGEKLAGQIQRGSASYLSMGNVQSDLSGAGFAINQLLERDNVAAKETSLVLASQYESLAMWAIAKFKGQPKARTSIRGFVASSRNREFFTEDVTPADLPETTAVMAEVELARPSDLVVRANIVRALNPGATRTISERAALENLLPDIAPDVQRELDDLVIDRVKDTEQFKVLEILKGLELMRRRAEADGNTEDVELIEGQIEMIKGTLMRTGNQQGPAPSGVSSPEALSTPTRTGGGPGPR